MKKGIAYFVLVSLMVFVLGLVTAGAQDEIPVYVDIKPTSCPNPLNVNKQGTLPVAILGLEDLDVTQIDPASIRLGEQVIGVEPLRWALVDVATPYNGISIENLFNCTECGPDGELDLVAYFDTQSVVEYGELAEADNRSELMLYFTGKLYEEFSGTPIRGGDMVVIIKPAFMDQPK